MKRTWSFRKWMRNLALLTMVAYTHTAVDAGDRYAVLVGIDRYAVDSKLAPLKYAANDMENLKSVLVQRGYKSGNILTLLSDDSENSKPTRENIVASLNNFMASHSMSHEDSIMVVFAGHGFNSNGDSYLCPVDYKATSPEDSSIRVGELANLLAENPAGEKYVVIDACRNEMIADADREFNLVSGLKKMRLLEEAKSQGMMFFSSCLAGQLSFEDSTLGRGAKKGSGVFMNYFIEGLEGAADVAGNLDGIVSAFELSTYASVMTNNYVNKVFDTNQRPWAESRSTSGMSLCEVPLQVYEERKGDWGKVERLTGIELIAREQAEDEIFDAVKFLAGGRRELAMARVSRAINIDEKYYFSRRLRSLLYVLEGNSNTAMASQYYEKAIADLASVGSQLRLRLPDTKSEIALKWGYEELGKAKPGDVLLVNKVWKEGDTEWLQVTGIRRNLTIENRSNDVEQFSNRRVAFVKLSEVANEATSKAMIEEYNRPVKPTEAEVSRMNLAQSARVQAFNGPQFTGERIERINNAAQIYNEAAAIANRFGGDLPQVPTLQSIPYVGGFLRW